MRAFFENLRVGPTEIVLLLGLALLFAGLWLWLGLGIALAACGAVMVLSALANGWMQHRELVAELNQESRRGAI
jgi:hypothetical protein